MEKKYSIVQYTTIFYGIMTFLGYSYISHYFKSFGVTIYHFLDFSEILLSFLNTIDLVILLVILFSLIVFVYYTQNFLNVIFNMEFQPILKKTTKFLSIIFTLIFAFRIFHNLGMNNLKYKFIGFSIFSTIILSIFFYLFTHRNFKNQNKYYSDFFIDSLKYIIPFVAIFLINIFYSSYRSEVKMNKIETDSISFIYDNTIVKTNDSIIYIGATSKYIFLYNLKSKDNFIYEKSNIKNLIFKKK